MPDEQPEPPAPAIAGDGKRSRLPARWLVMGVFVLSSVLNYLDRLTLTSLAPLLKVEFQLTNEQFGYILLAFNLVYAGSAPLAGLLIDRIGLNRGISLAVAVWSTANIATGLAGSLRGFVLTRAVLGLGESGGVPAVGKAITTYLPPSERALGHAVSQIGISVGGALAPLVAIGLATAYGWRYAFVATGALGFVWIPLWLWASKKAPQYPPGRAPGWRSGVRLLRDKRAWGLIGATALGMTPYALWFNWIAVFLTGPVGLTLQEAARPAAIPPLFANVGGLLGGWLSMRWIRQGSAPVAARTRACLWSALLLLATAAAPWMPDTALATAVISFSLLWAASFSVNIYSIPLDLYGREHAAFAVALLTSAYGFMTAVFSPLTGWVVDQYGFGPICMVIAVLPLAGYGLLRVTGAGGYEGSQELPGVG